MIDLNKMNDKLDKVLNESSKEEMLDWLKNHRVKKIRASMGAGDFIEMATIIDAIQIKDRTREAEFQSYGKQIDTYNLVA